MRFVFSFILAVMVMLCSTSAIAGISDNNKIKSGDALLLGGTQPGWIDVDGQNRGKTDLELIIRDADSSKTVAVISPGKSFIQSVPKNRVLVIKNTSSSETAKVYWHISGYSKSANARIEAG